MEVIVLNKLLHVLTVLTKVYKFYDKFCVFDIGAIFQLEKICGYVVQMTVATRMENELLSLVLVQEEKVLQIYTGTTFCYMKDYRKQLVSSNYIYI